MLQQSAAAQKYIIIFYEISSSPSAFALQKSTLVYHTRKILLLFCHCNIMARMNKKRIKVYRKCFTWKMTRRTCSRIYDFTTWGVEYHEVSHSLLCWTAIQPVQWSIVGKAWTLIFLQSLDCVVLYVSFLQWVNSFVHVYCTEKLPYSRYSGFPHFYPYPLKFCAINQRNQQLSFFVYGRLHEDLKL